MVLNQRDGGSILISEDTAEKVHAAMRALGYAPNPAARMLAQGRNQLLAVFNYDPASPYLRDSSYHRILVGVENGADQQDYDLLLLTRNRGGNARSVYRGGVNTLRLADGAIIMGHYPNHDELRRLTAEGYPFVCIGRRDVPDIQLNWVISDYQSAGFDGTRHLLELGHRRMAYVGDATLFDTHSTKARWSGCLDAARAVPDAELMQVDQSRVATAENVVALLREHELTALICNDAANFGQAMQSMAQAGIRVPVDVSILVLGDTLGDFATSMNVSYVRLNQERVGEEAVQLLTRRIEAGASADVEQILVPCEFVVGDTTGARPEHGELKG
jgi:DNA-binding LacI/PurR family transcriptional regulator